jgi:butyrate kinase
MDILVINPGGSSTKIAIFKAIKNHFTAEHAETAEKISRANNKVSIKKEFELTIRHPIDELRRFHSVLDPAPIDKRNGNKTQSFKHGFAQLGNRCGVDQLDYRKGLIIKAIGDRRFDAIVTRGGPLKPLKSGTYRITKKVVDDIKQGKIQSMHPSLLGPLISYSLAQDKKIPAFFVDPESVDEFFPLARISGLPEIPRKSLSHFLNTNAVVRKAAKKLGRRVNQSNFIIAHLGSGITVAAKEKGKQIDANNANEDGPFSPQRTGSLPLQGVVDMCFDGQHTKQQVLDKIQRKGGLLAYLGTDDIKEIEKRIKNGDKYADLIYNAMIFQIAKEIGSMFVALKGNVTAIIITGGIACQKRLVNKLKSWIKFAHKPILVFPGEEEMTALAEGTIRVLLGKEKIQKY